MKNEPNETSASKGTKISIGITYALILIWLFNIGGFMCVPTFISLVISVVLQQTDVRHHHNMMMYKEYKKQMKEYENTQDLEILKRLVAERELRNYMEN